MANIDAPSIIAMLSTDISDFAMLPDRSVQGVVNALYLMRLAKGPLADDPAFLIGPGGRSVIDRNFGPGNPIYSGNSQGGILGGVYMAASQDVERGVLGVPGLGYSMMMPRSSGTGAALISLIKGRYQDPVELMIIMHLVQMLWDRAVSLSLFFFLPPSYYRLACENKHPGFIVPFLSRSRAVIWPLSTRRRRMTVYPIRLPTKFLYIIRWEIQL